MTGIERSRIKIKHINPLVYAAKQNILAAAKTFVATQWESLSRSQLPEKKTRKITDVDLFMLELTRGSQQTGPRTTKDYKKSPRKATFVYMLGTPNPDRPETSTNPRRATNTAVIVAGLGANGAREFLEHLDKVDEGQRLDGLHDLVAHLHHVRLLGLRRRPLQHLLLCNTVD